MTTPTTSLREKLERHPDLSVDQYKAMVKWCRDAIDHNADFLYDKDLFDDAIASASRRFHLPPDSLISLLRNTHVWHVKIITRSVKAKLASHVDRYVRNGESMWHIAYSNRYPPCLLARAMLEVLLKPKNSFTLGRKGLTEAMRDPVGKLGCATGIHDDYLSSEQFPGPPYNGIGDKPLTRLAREVLHVIAVDPMYGPDHDQARHTIGVEYERLLEQLLIDMDIPFETEDQLRERGTSKTPDVLLSTPVAVQVKRSTGNSITENDDDDDWRIVCWIDSKALFGDTHTHKDSVLPQAESYIHRFGPGLLLYWFGHAPLLGDANRDLVITSWTLPDKFLLPTGEVVAAPISNQGSAQK